MNADVRAREPVTDKRATRRDWRTVPFVQAECCVCEARWEGAGGEGRGARRTAVLHARRERHKVRVEVTVTWIYQDAPAGLASARRRAGAKS